MRLYFCGECPSPADPGNFTSPVSGGWEGALRTLAALDGRVPKPKPRFGHLAEHPIGSYTLLGSFHPSQQNTFTGKLTEPMMDEVFLRARALTG